MAVRTETVDPDLARRPRHELADDLDHKRIGILYIVTAFFFFFAAGVMALLIPRPARPGGPGHFIWRTPTTSSSPSTGR